MSSFTPSYFSAQNNVTTTFSNRTELSLPEMKKKIITAFHAKNVYAPRGLKQTTNSFSARFPASWTMSPAYHTPGTRLLGSTAPKRAYRDITLDDRLTVDLFIDELDANARAILNFQDMFAMEMGQAIAQYDDQNSAIIAALVARASATVTGASAGTQITKASCDVNLGALNAALWDAKNALDEKNVSEIGRTMTLRYAQFNLLASSHDRMFNRQLGANGGSFGGRVSIPDYAGFDEIVATNNMPSTNIGSTPAGTRNDYYGNFTKTVGVGFSQGAFGTVYSSNGLPQGGGTAPAPTGEDTETQMHPLDVRSVVIPEAYGTLLLGSLVVGHGILNPPCGVEILKP